MYHFLWGCLCYDSVESGLNSWSLKKNPVTLHSAAYLKSVYLRVSFGRVALGGQFWSRWPNTLQSNKKILLLKQRFPPTSLPPQKKK